MYCKYFPIPPTWRSAVRLGPLCRRLTCVRMMQLAFLWSQRRSRSGSVSGSTETSSIGVSAVGNKDVERAPAVRLDDELTAERKRALTSKFDASNKTPPVTSSALASKCSCVVFHSRRFCLRAACSKTARGMSGMVSPSACTAAISNRTGGSIRPDQIPVGRK